MVPFVRPSELADRMRDRARGEHMLRTQRLCDDLALQPCLTTPGMGDQKSSAVAQAYNQHILLSSGDLSESTWMSYEVPAPFGRLWVGSYTDDILVLLSSEADAAGRPLSCEDVEPVQRLRRAHQLAGVDYTRPSGSAWRSFGGPRSMACGP